MNTAPCGQPDIHRSVSIHVAAENKIPVDPLVIYKIAGLAQMVDNIEIIGGRWHAGRQGDLEFLVEVRVHQRERIVYPS